MKPSVPWSCGSAWVGLLDLCATMVHVGAAAAHPLYPHRLLSKQSLGSGGESLYCEEPYVREGTFDWAVRGALVCSSCGKSIPLSTGLECIYVAEGHRQATWGTIHLTAAAETLAQAAKPTWDSARLTGDGGGNLWLYPIGVTGAMGGSGAALP